MVAESLQSLAYRCASIAFGQLLSYKPFYQVLALCLEEHLENSSWTFIPDILGHYWLVLATSSFANLAISRATVNDLSEHERASRRSPERRVRIAIHSNQYTSMLIHGLAY